MSEETPLPQRQTASGRICRIGHDYCFIEIDGYPETVFLHRHKFTGEWSELRRGHWLSFKLEKTAGARLSAYAATANDFDVEFIFP